MRKVEFAWLLPVCLVLVVLTIGVLLFSVLNRLQEPAAVASTSPPAAQDSTDARTAAALDTVRFESRAVAAGDALFKGNCAQCHAVHDVVVGPALAGISQRRPLTWLIPWVKNSGKVVASGDEYAVKLFNQYQKQQMPSFQLSAAEIKDIVTYIEAEAQAGRASSTFGAVATAN